MHVRWNRRTLDRTTAPYVTKIIIAIAAQLFMLRELKNKETISMAQSKAAIPNWKRSGCRADLRWLSVKASTPEGRQAKAKTASNEEIGT
jgi:hypothetical protein